MSLFASRRFPFPISLTGMALRPAAQKTARRVHEKAHEKMSQKYRSVWLLTMLSMFSIGLMVASLCRTTRSMNVATSLLYFPMLLFSGATIPAEVFPAGLRAVANVMPLGVGINLLKAVSLGATGGVALPLVTLAAIAVICSTVAVRSFRWE